MFVVRAATITPLRRRHEPDVERVLVEVPGDERDAELAGRRLAAGLERVGAAGLRERVAQVEAQLRLVAQRLVELAEVA